MLEHSGIHEGPLRLMDLGRKGDKEIVRVRGGRWLEEIMVS